MSNEIPTSPGKMTDKQFELFADSQHRAMLAELDAIQKTKQPAEQGTTHTADTARPYEKAQPRDAFQSTTATTSRPYEQSSLEEASRSRPSPKAVLAGVALSGVVAYGAATGAFNEADQERQLQQYDAQNKAANIANNPDLFGGEVELGSPKETVITVDPSTISTGEAETER